MRKCGFGCRMALFFFSRFFFFFFDSGVARLSSARVKDRRGVCRFVFGFQRCTTIQSLERKIEKKNEDKNSGFERKENCWFWEILLKNCVDK